MPNIDFTADHTEIPQGRYVNFSATSDKYIKHWLWIFSGAQPDTANYQNPQNIFYYTAGRYTVTLVGTDANGSAKVSKLGYITVDTAGYNKDIKVNYQYYKNDSLKYFINYNSLTINFGKGSFYNVEIKLFSLLGQELISYKQNSILITEDQTITLPLNLSNNVYILSIKTQNGYIHKKLMILH